MPPALALLLWAVCVVALFRFDPGEEGESSAALWVPVIWIFIVASRLPSQWIDGISQAAAVEDGNALDRVVYIVLILFAVGVLVSRSFEWRRLVGQNFALSIFLLFALMSVLWSDVPFVAFKRWFRDLGTYLVILVVLSDPRPLEALRTVLRRLCFLLLPLSIVLVKYFPEAARYYDVWTGTGYYTGVATSKNMLGVLCLVSGLYLCWDTLIRWGRRRERPMRRALFANAALFAMTLWLVNIADSATSRVCLALGCLLIALAQSQIIRRRPALLTVTIPVGVITYALLEFGLGIDILAELAEAVGRDPTLTGRTEIWAVVLSTNTNPVLGTGYESFWLGPRLQWVRDRSGGIGEAHNGYLEVYLNLGLVGLLLVVAFLIGSYGRICGRLRTGSALGSLGLGLWTILVFYNVTESALRGHLMWVAFLLVALSVPATGAGRGKMALAVGPRGEARDRVTR